MVTYLILHQEILKKGVVFWHDYCLEPKFNVVTCPYVFIFTFSFLDSLLWHTLYILKYLSLPQRIWVQTMRRILIFIIKNLVLILFYPYLFILLKKVRRIIENANSTCCPWASFSSIPYWDAYMSLMNINIYYFFDA